MKTIKPSIKKATSGRGLPKCSKVKKSVKGRTAKDPLFFIFPPIILACIFAYCAFNENPEQIAAIAAEKQALITASLEAIQQPKKIAKIAKLENKEPALVIPNDLNNDLAYFIIPDGDVNIITSTAKLSQSGKDNANYPASNATDGNIANDRKLAVARPDSGPAWWMAELEEHKGHVNTLVIYGGASASPEGKLSGGFEVEIQTIQGETLARQFCVQGFALEGHETWVLHTPLMLKSIKITSLSNKNPIVLREVQALGNTKLISI